MRYKARDFIVNKGKLMAFLDWMWGVVVINISFLLKISGIINMHWFIAALTMAISPALVLMALCLAVYRKLEK